MPRTIGSSGAKTVAAIRQAGLRLIYRHGYEAMTLRQLASEVGILQGSLYNHIRTKQDLLFKLITLHMEDLLREMDDTLKLDGAPTERLTAFVRFHVDYHMTRRREVFICYSELRSLDPKNFKAIVKMRRSYEQKLTDILNAGVTEGAFSCSDTKVATYGILSMLAGICNWFSPAGRLSKGEITELFTSMALNSVMNSGRPDSDQSESAVPLAGIDPSLATAEQEKRRTTQRRTRPQ